MSSFETTMGSTSPAMARDEVEIANALLRVSGALGVLVWTPGGRTMASGRPGTPPPELVELFLGMLCAKGELLV